MFIGALSNCREVGRRKSKLRFEFRRTISEKRIAERSAGRWMVRGALDSWKAQVDKKILDAPRRKEGARRFDGCWS